MQNQSGRLMKQSLLTRQIWTLCGHSAVITSPINPVTGNIIVFHSFRKVEKSGPVCKHSKTVEKMTYLTWSCSDYVVGIQAAVNPWNYVYMHSSLIMEAHFKVFLCRM